MTVNLFYDRHDAKCQSGHVTKISAEDFEQDKSIQEIECGECTEIFEVEMRIDITYISRPRNHADKSKIQDSKRNTG